MEIKQSYKRRIAKRDFNSFGAMAVGLVMIICLYVFNGLQNLRENIAWNQIEEVDEEINAKVKEREDNEYDNLFMNLNEENSLYEERKILLSEFKDSNYDTIDFYAGKEFVYYAILSYTVLLYPVRFSIIVIIWSINVLKKNTVTK